MFKRKKVIAGLALLGGILIAGAGLAGCHRPPMLCAGACHGEGFAEHVLERMDAEVADLELTVAQQGRYQEIRAQMEGQLVDIAHSRKALFQEVKTEMGKDSPDLAMVADLLKIHSRQFPERMTFFLDRFMDFYGVLDAQQQGKIVDRLKAKLKKFEAFRELVCD